MGYSQSWCQISAPATEEWARIRRDILSIAACADIPIRISNPLDEDVVRIDGVGEDACETFTLRRGGTEHGFCKTLQRPYDVVVAATLIYLDCMTEHYDIALHDHTDVDAALALARRALPHHAEHLKPKQS